MCANPLIMPIGDWLFGGIKSNDTTVIEAVQRVHSFRSAHQINEPWRSIDDLPEELQESFRQLWHANAVRQWCYQTREWKSLTIDWKTLVLLPFASTPARVAAVYLKQLTEKHWPRRLARIEWLGIDPFACNDYGMVIGGYAIVMWELWRSRSIDSVLNVTACPKELVGASILIASFDYVPVYLWSERFQDSLWLPGWALPLLNDQQEGFLRNLLNGTPFNQIAEQTFLSRWLPVVGEDASTATATILRERFNWLDQYRSQESFEVT